MDTRYIGETKDGQYYNVSQREINKAEYESNEAWGENIRGGLGGAIGSLIGGKEGAAKGAVIDQVAMSFAGVGTPYGKVEPIRPIEKPFLSTTEIQIRYSDEYVRNWYDIKVNSLNTSVTFTEKNARMLNEQRNTLKIEARSMMSNRELASKLDITDPIRPMEYYIQKYSAQNYSGTNLWQRIIQGSTTPNKSVNQNLGIKNYYYGK